MTSEEENGIVKQPKGLCSTIDKCRMAIYNNDRETAVQLLEELKGEAIDLRTWGEEWKNKALNK